MTISVAWVRSVGTVKELVMASDSRLAFGARWDCCPKIVPFARGDCAISFAGGTAYAYPVMLQAAEAIAQHPRLRSRGTDLEDLKGHLLRVLNHLVELVHDLPRVDNPAENYPDTTFLLGGWSWKRGRFNIWLLHFDQNLRRFTFRPSTGWAGQQKGGPNKVLALIGDHSDIFKQNLVALLRKKRKLDRGGFDMEPLEVLRDMLREQRYDAIGGAPQVLKIYKYSSCRPYGIYWPDIRSGRITLFGRPLLEYEKSDYLVLDLDTMATWKHMDERPVKSADL